MPCLKNEYFIVYESNVKEGAHINRAPPLICKSSWNWTKKEIVAKLLVHLGLKTLLLALDAWEEGASLSLEVGSRFMVSLVYA